MSNNITIYNIIAKRVIWRESVCIHSLKTCPQTLSLNFMKIHADKITFTRWNSTLWPTGWCYFMWTWQQQGCNMISHLSRLQSNIQVILKHLSKIQVLSLHDDISCLHSFCINLKNKIFSVFEMTKAHSSGGYSDCMPLIISLCDHLELIIAKNMAACLFYRDPLRA